MRAAAPESPQGVQHRVWQATRTFKHVLWSAAIWIAADNPDLVFNGCCRRREVQAVGQ
jgi:hypothetical protein